VSIFWAAETSPGSGTLSSPDRKAVRTPNQEQTCALGCCSAFLVSALNDPNMHFVPYLKAENMHLWPGIYASRYESWALIECLIETEPRTGSQYVLNRVIWTLWPTCAKHMRGCCPNAAHK